MAYETLSNEINFISRIEVIPRYDIEIIAPIYGYLTIANISTLHDLVGTFYLDKTGDYSSDIISTISVNDNVVQAGIDIRLFLYTDDITNEILGTVTLDKNKAYYTILDGKANIKKYKLSNLDGYIDGRLSYEQDRRVRDLYCKFYLDKTGDNITDIYGTLTYNKESLEENNRNTIIGKVKIPQYYRAIDLPSRITIRNRIYYYSIFGKLTVPPTRTITIPCRITIEPINKLEQNILQGTITLLPKDKLELDILQGIIDYREGRCIDIPILAHIEAIYTRREFDASIYVVETQDYNITSTIEVAGIPKEKDIEDFSFPPKGYYPIPKDLHIPLLDPYKKIHININENNKTTTIVDPPKYDLALNHIKQLEDHNTTIKGKIIIAVSPTWRYEAYVFKNSIITFLDRYYRKADFAICFIGDKRAEYDVLNLSLNYKISKDNLCSHVIKRYEQLPYLTLQNIINHTMEFRKEDYPNILRVFLFMNQPTFYYNDPLNLLVTYCRENNISTVAIGSDGDYTELCQYDRVMDELASGIEWERQHRNYKTTYTHITIDNEDRIVY